MIEIFIYILSFLLTCMFLLSLWNIYIFKKQKSQTLTEYPFISVLIPARNEERNIKNCVLSVLNQNYPAYEIIVLDDNSSDSTKNILYDIKKKFSHLNIINGLELPAGWTGKNFACHQLFLASKGNILLFIDADTILKKDGLKKAAERMISRRADLYTLFPEMILNTLPEKIIMPALHFTTFMTLPYYLVEHSKNPAFAMGAGPFMMFNRSAYEKTGGHLAVKDDIVEDIRLTKEIKKNHLRLIADKGQDIISVRMYTSFIEIWKGFSKNIFPGMGYSLVIFFLVIILYAMFFLSPYGFLIYGFSAGSIPVILFSAYQILILLISRVIINKFFTLPQISAFLHPIGIITVLLFALNSFRINVFGSGSRWKGRTYTSPNTNKKTFFKLNLKEN